MGPAFRHTPAIIVAPDSIAGPWTNEENELAVLKIYDHIVENYNIDQSRTLLTGFSMGGHGTWYIAGRNQDRFSCAIPMAGLPDESITDWTIPVYAIHSPVDKVVPIDPTRKYVRAMRKEGFEMRLSEPRNLPHRATSSFAPALRNAVPWVDRVWAKSSQRRGDAAGGKRAARCL